MKRALKDNAEPDPDKPPPVLIITFKTRTKKHDFIRTRSKTKQNITIGNFCKEVATDNNSNTAIYISENLTAGQQELFYIVRKYKTENNYKYAWTKHGAVYIRKSEAAKAQRIDTKEDLENLMEEE